MRISSVVTAGCHDAKAAWRRALVAGLARGCGHGGRPSGPGYWPPGRRSATSTSVDFADLAPLRAPRRSPASKRPAASASGCPRAPLPIQPAVFLQRHEIAVSEPLSVHVGTSGWRYPHWDHVLYPPGTDPRERLGHYVQRFDTVELNSSFYRWPSSPAFKSWRNRLPPGFALSVKAARGLTHGKRLYAPEAWVARMAACWHELSDKRAVLLVQMRPDHVRDDARLEYFLGLMPPWMRVAR